MNNINNDLIEDLKKGKMKYLIINIIHILLTSFITLGEVLLLCALICNTLPVSFPLILSFIAGASILCGSKVMVDDINEKELATIKELESLINTSIEEKIDIGSYANLNIVSKSLSNDHFVLVRDNNSNRIKIFNNINEDINLMDEEEILEILNDNKEKALIKSYRNMESIHERD